MSLLGPGDRRRLGRYRLVLRSTHAGRGSGSRRSEGAGSGIEFADYRAYGPGDDASRIDPTIHARLGQYVVREKVVERSVATRILLDLTASMTMKADRAKEVASALAFMSSAAGDPVQVGTFTGDGLAWSPPATDSRRIDALLGWLEARRVGGGISLEAVARLALAERVPIGHLLVISDGWFGDAVSGLRRLAAGVRELSWILPLEPTESEPVRLGRGSVRLIDAETGRRLETVLDEATLRRVRERTLRHHAELRAAVAGARGRLAVVSVDDDLLRTVSHTLVRAGIVA